MLILGVETENFHIRWNVHPLQIIGHQLSVTRVLLIPNQILDIITALGLMFLWLWLLAILC